MFVFKTLVIWLVRLLCQSCRSLSRQKRRPGCTTRRWIYFALCPNTTT